MPVFYDHLQRAVLLHAPPRRIVSVVPSQSELLYHLGLEAEVVGITKFCVHPETWFRSKTRVGGTKQLHLDTIRDLNPDLIIANKEENVREQIEALAADFPVWVSDVDDLRSAIRMIHQIGDLTGRSTEAEGIAGQIGSAFSRLPARQPTISAAYLIWKDPWMTVGGDTFIHQMMRYAGFHNVFEDSLRYPETTIGEIKASGCEVVLLSSEPYPFRQKQAAELEAVLDGTRVLCVDGEMFSWYGSRLREAAPYLSSLQSQAFSLF